MSSFGDVRFITASDAARIFKRKGISYDDGLILTALERLGNAVKFVRLGGDYGSPSELFYVITRCLAAYSKTGKTPRRVRPREPLGPLRMTASHAPSTVAADDLLAASAVILTEMDSTGRLPSSIRLGGGAVLSPADFMVTCGRVLAPILRGGSSTWEGARGQGEISPVASMSTRVRSDGVPLGDTPRRDSRLRRYSSRSCYRHGRSGRRPQ